MTEDNRNQELFIQLILQNQQMAELSLGTIKNPVTGKIEKNPEFARLSIDTLDMLLVKTKGNLLEAEEKYLTEVIKGLKMKYVEEFNHTEK